MSDEQSSPENYTQVEFPAEQWMDVKYPQSNSDKTKTEPEPIKPQP